MKKIKWLIGICVILVLAFLYAHIEKANMIYDKSIDSSEYQNTGVVEGLIEQNFVCTEDSLDGISAKCQLNGDTAGVSVKMGLYDNETNKQVAESEVDAEKIKNGKFNERIEGRSLCGRDYRGKFRSNRTCREILWQEEKNCHG